MPAIPTILNVFRVALRWQNGGQNAVNVMHFHVPGGCTPGQLMACMDAHSGAAMWNSVISSAVVSEVDITPLDGSSATETFVPATPGHWTGSGGGTEWAPAVAGVIKLTTALRGRSNRGRLFLPMTAENEMVNGFLRTLIVPGMQTAWNTFKNGCHADATTPADLCVASYKLATAVNVLDAHVEAALATQRRRQSRLR